MITKDQIVNHVLRIKAVDEDCAKHALAYYAKAFPDWKLNRAVSEALAEADKQQEQTK